MKSISHLLILLFTVISIAACDDDEYLDSPIKINSPIVTIDVPASGGKYSISTEDVSNPDWCWFLDKIMVKSEGLSKVLYNDNQPSGFPYLDRNQNLGNAQGYVCNNYKIYQWKDQKNVVCKIGRNKTGKERTFEIRFAQLDTDRYVELRQAP